MKEINILRGLYKSITGKEISAELMVRKVVLQYRADLCIQGGRKA
jgi:hypothetical protein